MRLGKIVLLFQAVITLMLGMVFLHQVLTLEMAKVSELKVQVNSPEKLKVPTFIDVKKRYESAAYILLIVSLMEIAIIAKLVS